MKKTLFIILSLALAATAHALILGPATSVTYAPNAPTLSSVSSASATSLSLVWSYGTTDASHSAATSVSVYRGTSAGAESGTPVATGVTSSPWADTGLTTSQPYYYYLKAVNTAGSSVASNEASGTPTATVYAPSAPTIVTATAGNASASVSFTPGVVDGTHSAATSYTATSSPGSITGTGASSPISVTGLTNDTAYTFTVTASNSAGTSSPSDASNSVIPTSSTTHIDEFNGSSVGAMWTAVTSTGSSIAVSGGNLVVSGASVASGGSYKGTLLYRNTAINPAIAKSYHFYGKLTGLNLTDTVTFPIVLSRGVPTASAITNQYIALTVQTTGSAYLIYGKYIDSGATTYYWKDTTNNWNTSGGTNTYFYTSGTNYEWILEISASQQFRFIVKDSGGAQVFATPFVNFSSVGGSGSWYLTTGPIGNGGTSQQSVETIDWYDEQ